MSNFLEHERLHLQKLNLLDELQRMNEEEKALREKVSALEKLESTRQEELASKIVTGILEEKLESVPSTLPKVSLDWASSPEKVRELYATQTKALWR